MFKIFLTLAVFIGSLTSAAAQEKPVDPNSTKQTNYSESSSYEPRKFEVKAPAQKKKSKPDSDENNKARNSENTVAQIDSAVAELKIPVLVYDAKGTPVGDLKNADVKLLVDEKEQEILTFEKAAQPLDLVLIVDMSPSTSYNPKDIRDFVTKITEALKPQDKIQIISFNQEVKILCESTSDKKLINKAVKNLEIGDGTSIYEAVETIFQKIINSGDGQKSIILLSDGVDTTSRKTNYITSLLAAENSLAAVFPFYLNTFDTIPRFTGRNTNIFLGMNDLRRPGVTKEEYARGLAYLQDLAALSGGRAIHVKSLTETKTDEIARILEFLKPQYFISFKLAENAAPAERKQLKVRINRPNLIVVARGSYLAR
jgi:VWFA-related protein